jgi:hypothetical protein
MSRLLNALRPQKSTPARRRIRKEGKKMFTAEFNDYQRERAHMRAYRSAFIAWIKLVGILRWLPIMIVAVCFSVAANGQQYYFVDCSGTNPNDFATIDSALAVAGPGSIALVTGTCTENVAINNAWNLNVGAWNGQTANIAGNVSVLGSNSVFHYGLNVSNPAKDAFDINSSHAVTLEACTGKGGLSNGLNGRCCMDRARAELSHFAVCLTRRYLDGGQSLDGPRRAFD